MVTKKQSPKKPIVKKPASKKNTPKKPQPKNPVPKKPVSKKPVNKPASKPVQKKPVSKTITKSTNKTTTTQTTHPLAGRLNTILKTGVGSALGAISPTLGAIAAPAIALGSLGNDTLSSLGKGAYNALSNYTPPEQPQYEEQYTPYTPDYSYMDSYYPGDYNYQDYQPQQQKISFDMSKIPTIDTPKFNTDIYMPMNNQQFQPQQNMQQQGTMPPQQQQSQQTQFNPQQQPITMQNDVSNNINRPQDYLNPFNQQMNKKY